MYDHDVIIQLDRIEEATATLADIQQRRDTQGRHVEPSEAAARYDIGTGDETHWAEYHFDMDGRKVCVKVEVVELGRDEPSAVFESGGKTDDWHSRKARVSEQRIMAVPYERFITVKNAS